MFPSKAKIRDAINQLFKLYEPLQRGDMLSHAKISAVLGVEPNQHPWQYIIQKLNRKMEEERGISLVCVITEGYRLATHEEQLRLGPMRTKRALRQIRRGRNSVESLPAGELTFHQQQVRMAMGQKLAATENNLRQETRLQSFLMRPRESMPYRVVAELDGQDTGEARSA